MTSRRRVESVTALALYLLVTGLYFGIQLAVHHGGRTFVGSGFDPQIFAWAFGWWPYAIGHGENPVVTHAIWAPTGVNLAWATSVPGLALLFAPLTVIVGPLASFDTAAVLMPALAAFTAFLLCRYLTRSFWPALFGGYLFGFSSYMLASMQGHIFLTAVFPLPLLVLVLVRLYRRELGARGFVLRFGVLLALEITFSTEIAFTLTLALVASIVAGVLLLGKDRNRLPAMLVPIVGGYALAVILASPLLYFAVTDFHHEAINPVSPTNFTLDLLNLFVPTGLTAFGHWWTSSIAQNFPAGFSESGGYLGLPLLAIVAWYVTRARRSAGARLLLVLLLVAVVASLGSWLHVDGHRVVTLPWDHLGYLPLFDNVLPVRLMLFVALITSIVGALWAAAPNIPRTIRIGLPVLAVLALVPNYYSSWTTRVDEPAFVTHRLYEQCIGRAEKVAVFPFSNHGSSMIWQADANFWFPMTGGYVSPLPPEAFRSPPEPTSVGDIAVYSSLPDHDVSGLLQFVRLKHVDVIAVEARTAQTAFWRSLLRGVAKPQLVGGVYLYRLDGSKPCRV